MAISVAYTDCYEAEKPSDLYNNDNEWNDDGYRVDTSYRFLDKPFPVIDHRDWLVENYKTNSAFTVNGTGKQQYMCALDDNHAIYLLKEIKKLQFSKDVMDVLEDALNLLIRINSFTMEVVMEKLNHSRAYPKDLPSLQ